MKAAGCPLGTTGGAAASGRVVLAFVYKYATSRPP